MWGRAGNAAHADDRAGFALDNRLDLVDAILFDMTTVRIITRDNAVGLGLDLRLVADTLAAAGHRVETVGYGGNQAANRLREAALWARSRIRGPVDVQIFLERVYKRCLPLARHNLLVPNPEWFLPKWERLLPRFERVLCKTRHAESIFRELGCETAFTGFTSHDPFDPQVRKRPVFFHLAGRSTSKGTDAVLEAWRNNPQWPLLTVVQHPKLARPGPDAGNIDHRADYVPTDELRQVQNSARFHLCPSEAEGFGHYLMEGLAVGAVVFTTDAAPMNELVAPRRGILIPPARSERRGLVEYQFVDVAGIEAAVERALSLDQHELEAMGSQARAFFLDNDRRFREGLAAACLDGLAVVRG